MSERGTQALCHDSSNYQFGFLTAQAVLCQFINAAIKNLNRNAGLDKPAPDYDPGASIRIDYGFRLSPE
ncbi:MAG: hypothetical protein JXA35_11655 [Deltaproteobacteria bacterium]|nr:hypothetical protein [Deltaproteobacteria bacterium]